MRFFLSKSPVKPVFSKAVSRHENVHGFTLKATLWSQCYGYS